MKYTKGVKYTKDAKYAVQEKTHLRNLNIEDFGHICS